MKIEKAKRLFDSEYEKAKKLEWVHNPVAYALYQVWKMADAHPTEKGNVQWMKQGKCPVTPEQFEAIYNDDTTEKGGE